MLRLSQLDKSGGGRSSYGRRKTDKRVWRVFEASKD